MINDNPQKVLHSSIYLVFLHLKKKNLAMDETAKTIYRTIEIHIENLMVKHKFCFLFSMFKHKVLHIFF